MAAWFPVGFGCLNGTGKVFPFIGGIWNSCWKMDFNGPGGVSSPTKKWFLAASGESN